MITIMITIMPPAWQDVVNVIVHVYQLVASQHLNQSDSFKSKEHPSFF